MAVFTKNVGPGIKNGGLIYICYSQVVNYFDIKS